MLFHHLKSGIDFPHSWLSIWEQVQPLCQRLQQLAPQVDQEHAWPEKSLQAMAEAGVFRWFIPQHLQGWEWNPQQQLAGYLALCHSCLTSTFILTQWQAAVRRILTSQIADIGQDILPKLAAGQCFATVGISHLSTSRQHLNRPMLVATPTAEGYVFNGSSPWVTGGAYADWIVIGATQPDQSQILALVDGRAAGVTRHDGMALLALSSSCTDRVDLQDVIVPRSHLLAGPALNVMAAGGGSGGGTGGLQTSTLAIGLAMQAIEYLFQQAQLRPELLPIAEQFMEGLRPLVQRLKLATDGKGPIDLAALRQHANSLVLRSTQAALQAAKGAGFVSGHPTGRWAREGLFFLVWSCPPSVIEGNLCELAGANARFGPS